MPSVFDVTIEKTMRAGNKAFELAVAFQSTSKRLIISGPSGAGKTLLLKAIAGLLTPEAGHIRFGEQDLFDKVKAVNRSPQARRMGYVFQDYALFPHLNVRQNIAFGLTKRWLNPRAAIETPELARWLQAFQLDGVAHQFPDQLSGGQRQRTALARALVGEPRALLLDEPFAALDARLRERLRDELAELLLELDLPVILITHDESDIRAMDGEAIYLSAGRRIVP